MRDDDGGGPCAISDEADVAVMVQRYRAAFDGLKPIYACRMYYAAHALRTCLQSLLKRGRSANNRWRYIWRLGRMTVNGVITYTGTLIQASQYLISSIRTVIHKISTFLPDYRGKFR